MFKIGGFYKTKHKGEWVYIQKKTQKGYYAIFVTIDKDKDGNTDYSEDFEFITKKELLKEIKDKTCFVPFRSRKYQCFYAIWDGANKETFKYLLPKDIIEDLNLKKGIFQKITLRRNNHAKFYNISL